MNLLAWKSVSYYLTLAVLLTPLAASANELLLRDDFDGTGIVDSTVWRLPFGTEGTFVGRTQYRGDSAVDMPLQGVAEALATDGKVTEIKLDTYSPLDPGNAFLGTDLLTKRNFAQGGGITFEARMRLKPTTAGGVVGGFFLYDVTRDSPAGANNLVRDEIDWELLGNQGVSGGAQDPATNYWNDGPFTGPGSGGDLEFHNVAGLNLTQFQNYKVEWTPQSLKWFVNDQLVRTETTNIPNDPQKLHFNMWAPDSGFAAAFNAALQPAATPGAGVTYAAQIDHVEVNRINTVVSSNLLTDGSFEENFAPTFIGDVPATTTGTWLRFGNVSYEADDISGTNPNVPDMAPDGVVMAKMFGPFNGGPDASGILQNVAATPGQQFEASVFAQTAGGDSIVGTQNFNTIAITFLDASGNVLQEAFADPGNIVDRNRQEFPLLDGRDPNVVEDEFVKGTVNAIAPAGTAFARVSLFFIQLANEGGASWFDDAQLRLLTPEAPMLVPGDFNADGKVDNGDLNLLLGSWGSSTIPAAWVNGFVGPTVDNGELNALLGDWGFGTGVAVPEPGTVALALLALAGMVSRRV
ncbi:glycoside hydrolase family 16 protein [Botrimarina hoheduenensis]|uniref:Beta-glucanase n=1 Tax=Botrimarina hoheduenensis TaxID=2528000 RepID=A0A5C5VT87_9BACT|nr:glycoside hydrolase family 16 protein [Botrimarina hoheduenensis]TWT40839.1 Beta-glucanase precursor [Botrimarina hoheduenensis]